MMQRVPNFREKQTYIHQAWQKLTETPHTVEQDDPWLISQNIRYNSCEINSDPLSIQLKPWTICPQLTLPF